MAKSKSPTHLFSVALDFGTTFSGFAYSSKGDFQRRQDQVYAYTSWNAGGQSLISSKTPTCLLLTAKKEFEAFGYEAENKYADLALENLHRDRYFFRRYKMKLHGNERLKEKVLIEDESGKPVEALLVFSLSIKYLADKFIQLSKTQGLEIKDEEIIWTLTVPAIWSESAKSFMRRAAIKAGIKNEQLKIALEPEAASLLCQYIPTEKSKEGISVTDVGTKYMVIDLGGGTVDITVHEKLHGGKLKEIHKASGGPWGGTAVDEGFIQLLTKVVGGPVITRFRKEHTADYLEMMREFEVSKRSLDPQNDISFKVRMPPTFNELCKNETDESLNNLITTHNSPFKGKMKILGDKLVLNRELMINIFEHIEKKTVTHVKEILRLDGVKDISCVLLVGGFAESAMVQHFFREQLESKSRKVIVPQEAGLSIVKGAVIAGHLSSPMESRIARFTYGYGARIPFDSSKHPESRKVVSEKGNVQCRGAFRPFVTAGISIKTGDIIKRTLSLGKLDEGHFDVYYTDAQDVILCDDKRLHRLYRVRPKDIVPKETENHELAVFQFSFGDTEVETEIHLPKSGFRAKLEHRFKLD